MGEGEGVSDGVTEEVGVFDGVSEAEAPIVADADCVTEQVGVFDGVSEAEAPIVGDTVGVSVGDGAGVDDGELAPDDVILQITTSAFGGPEEPCICIEHPRDFSFEI